MFGRFLFGRIFAYKSKYLLNSTLTDLNPSPIGVVEGAFRAILFFSMDFIVSQGRVLPYFSIALEPIRHSSQFILIPVD